ncbi:MAG: response regulator [Pseudomonadota bacterium]
MTHATPTLTAMIVDDSLVDQKLAQRALEKSGLVERVVCFLYPDEALDFLRRKQRPEIDVVLLDLHMPRLNGIDFLETVTQELGEECLGTVAILATSPTPEDTARAFGFSAVKHVIAKPLQADDVLLVCAPDRWTPAHALLRLPNDMRPESSRADLRVH